MGRGSVFRVLLPVARGEAAEVVRAVVPAAGGRRGRILVVDDEPMLGTAMRRMLSPEHEVLAVTSARRALEQIERGDRFDVIFCDLMMPEVTGMELHAELSRRSPEQAQRVVFMTGGVFTSKASEFLAQVRNQRLEKPFEVAALRALVHSLLRQSSA